MLFKGLTETFEGLCDTVVKTIPNMGRGRETREAILVGLS
jgi:hypothetical protein